MKLVKILLVNVLVCSLCLGLFSFKGYKSAEWSKKTNPVAANAQKGKALWEEKCQACHGDKGQGNRAKKVYTLNPVKNQTCAACHKTGGKDGAKPLTQLSDGQLFYVTAVKGDVMPGFHDVKTKAGKLKENDVWQLVHYMKTLDGMK